VGGMERERKRERERERKWTGREENIRERKRGEDSRTEIGGPVVEGEPRKKHGLVQHIARGLRYPNLLRRPESANRDLCFSVRSVLVDGDE